MTSRDDMKLDGTLYRAVITVTWDGDPDAPEWSVRRNPGTAVNVYGPYATPGPAKAWITKETNWRKDDPTTRVEGQVEISQPEWWPVQ